MIDQEVFSSWLLIITLVPLGLMLILMMKVFYELFRSNAIHEFFNSNNKVCSINDETISQLDDNLKNRYEELIKAVNNDMPLSFFWLAGSIIEGILCEYCKKNNIKSNKNDIDGYITALYPDEKNKKNDEKNSKLPQSNAIKHILNIYRNYRNTIHLDNQNNDFIKDKNLQNRKEELDDVIKYFCNDN